MSVNNLIETIFNSMVSVRSVEDNSNLLDKFTTEEVYDMANAVVVGLPKYPDQILSAINNRVIKGIPEYNREVKVQKDIKDLIRLYITKTINKEQEMLLITLMLLEYSNKYNNNITNDFEEVFNYFISHLIHNQTQLQQEIVDNPTTAQTHVVGNFYLRVEDTGDILPTLNTLEKYKNYLINI